MAFNCWQSIIKLRRLKITLQYDGTKFYGWQIQVKKRTVQGVLEETLSKLLNSQTQVQGSGRTDAGVHAKNQVAHFDTENLMPTEAILRALNFLVPEDVCIKSIEEINDDFHARFSAVARLYLYRVRFTKSIFERNFVWQIHYKLDFEKMREAAKLFIGEKNMISFCRMHTETNSYFCKIYEIDFEELQDGFNFRIKANRFLHSTVRMILGTLVEIGRGHLKIDDLERILASDEKQKIGMTAPSLGLFLEQVFY